MHHEEEMPGHKRSYKERIEKSMKKSPAHDHHVMMEAEIRRRFIVAAFFTVPVLVLSPSIQSWFGYTLLDLLIWDILLVIFATIVILYGGLFFYKGAVASLRKRLLDMNVLVSIALISGYLYSLGTTFFGFGQDFYWEISTLASFILFGHWMEMRASRTASGAIRELVKLIPPTANLMKNGSITIIPTAKLNVDDLIIVKPGEKVPIDGMVVNGETSINEAMLTGESTPVLKTENSNVIGGTINVEGAIKVKVTKTGEQTAVAQIIKLVEQASASKPNVQRYADKAATYLTLIAIFVGGGTFAFWFGVGAGSLFALTLAITVIVITCPHALGLAIPTVTTISTTIAAKNGMLVRNAQALEIAKIVDTVIFDKTGTLTKGEFGVSDIVKLGKWSEKQVLEVAAALEINSEHVIAKAIVKKAQTEGIKIKQAQYFQAVSGKGAKAIIDDNEVHVGNTAFMKDLNATFTPNMETFSRLAAEGKTVVYVAVNRQIAGLIGLADLIRDESKEAIRQLKELNLEVAMLTGDNKQTAAYVSKELGLDTYFAEVLPDQKANAVKTFQDQGKRVAMVGDGVNDAPALVQANVGIAIGAGTDIAVASADVVLIKNDPRDVSKLINLSKKTMRKMNENLVWATGYNVIAIPVAAGVLVPIGVVLRPEIGAVTMSISSISVIINALLLRRAKI